MYLNQSFQLPERNVNAKFTSEGQAKFYYLRFSSFRFWKTQLSQSHPKPLPYHSEFTKNVYRTI